ncbi:uncharacterized protein LOC143352897 isoform X2 [Halictus rubicundus]|uniref:uncharacterized protein LOC143352897 isoform X2 n=1 Tax=Halictus rubicundus TaxID=77578 RepID=UPI004036D7A8
MRPKFHHKAIKIISEALTLRNYENLHGLVDEITIEIIKKKVDGLASAQRRLITVSDAGLTWYVNYSLGVKDGRVSDCDYILEISQLGYYLPGLQDSQNSDNVERRMFITENGVEKLGLMVFNYTFQRNYKNGIGGPWMATVVNHFSITS